MKNIMLIGLDVHKATISVAIAHGERGEKCLASRQIQANLTSHGKPSGECRKKCQ